MMIYSEPSDDPLGRTIDLELERAFAIARVCDDLEQRFLSREAGSVQETPATDNGD